MEDEGEGHDRGGHGHGHLPNGRSVTKPLVFAFAVTCSFAVFELVGGWFSGSLALLSDSGHMFTDALALALSLAAAIIATRESTERQSFGYLRVEIVVALLNGIALIAISGYILFESYQRYNDPQDIEAPLMLGVALVGLVANIISLSVLRGRTHENLNVKGAFLHIAGDLLSSVGVIVAAILIYLYDLTIADPVISAVIGLVIMYSAVGIVKDSMSVLLEFAPGHVKAEEVRDALLKVEGVIEVHDIHMWTLSSGIHAISAHVVVEDRPISACSCVLRECEEVLRHRFDFSHVTIQLEATACELDACFFKGKDRDHDD
ncbi:MAG: cation diffusion facilitator family transporter [Euryarchaeota archaeon]|nr:cation diffusion facilitator family transporter [Euryarchaeota archaeon]